MSPTTSGVAAGSRRCVHTAGRSPACTRALTWPRLARSGRRDTVVGQRACSAYRGAIASICSITSLIASGCLSGGYLYLVGVADEVEQVPIPSRLLREARVGRRHRPLEVGDRTSGAFVEPATDVVNEDVAGPSVLDRRSAVPKTLLCIVELLQEGRCDAARTIVQRRVAQLCPPATRRRMRACTRRFLGEKPDESGNRSRRSADSLSMTEAPNPRHSDARGSRCRSPSRSRQVPGWQPSARAVDRS